MKTNPRPRACRLTNNLSFASNISITCATYVNIMCRYISTLTRYFPLDDRRVRSLDQFFSNISVKRWKKIRKRLYFFVCWVQYAAYARSIWIFFLVVLYWFFFLFTYRKLVWIRFLIQFFSSRGWISPTDILERCIICIFRCSTIVSFYLSKIHISYLWIRFLVQYFSSCRWISSTDIIERCSASYAQSIWIFFLPCFTIVYFIYRKFVRIRFLIRYFSSCRWISSTDIYERCIVCIFPTISFYLSKFHAWIRFLFPSLVENSYEFDFLHEKTCLADGFHQQIDLERRCAPSFINKFSNRASGSLFRPPLLRRAYKRIVTRMTKEGKKRGRSAGTAASMSVILLNWSAFE